ncbi:peptide-N-glycosidase F-related protein [uncultured Dokdonia sp.]|uniref:peptide-N-glycosidase F-related protein n=1 Tax=uncultured Dokdonia sp. TaxID=575653 RepID=UPI002622A7AC|nr:peptide-N-glycosidase F-related protein [uncultured Dokdonia sp.]
MSVSLDFDESDFPNHIAKKQEVLPLVNTTKYASGQRLFDAFSKNTLTVDFSIDASFKNIKLHYITTGHGGHGGGDEFVKKENVISLDGTTIKSFIPWRDDCASFRRFNPTSATWPANKIMEGETSTQQIASSDFSRSNWCPGSDVIPEVISLENVTAGKHTLSIAIPEAQVATDTENNYWMVSAYLTYDIE